MSSRGATGTDTMQEGTGRGTVLPCPLRKGAGKRAAPFPIFFLIFGSLIAYFGAFWGPLSATLLLDILHNGAFTCIELQFLPRDVLVHSAVMLQ